MTTPTSLAPPSGAGTRVRRMLAAARWLTTPLLPEDYLALVNPLWSADDPRGRVEAVRHEAPGAATVEIRPGPDWRGHRPGQWVKIGVDVGGVRHWRTFSLSSPPRRDGLITITVKATPDGVVSRHLVRDVLPGTIVRLSAAEGDFTLPERVPERLLFLTAGSGITPVMAMLRDGVDGDVVHVHSARTPRDVIFGTELRELPVTLHERHTAASGRFKLAELDELCPDWRERDTWACGPSEMLDDIEAHWRDAGASDRLRVERFKPPVLAAGGEGGRVRFTASGVETDADGATPLLTAGEDAGALLPSGCRMGICYSCVGRLASGRVRDLRTGEVHGEEGHLIQTCVSAAAGPVEIDL
ncbi:ferredoxin reductase [Actinomadura rupiterrae]|uniref:ferredoxin reductase n=1 Tax=Actinomadura rupiterrae TaxID=559627 RepID=UPI0020A31C4F|nr:ferredoxin reductase [Actinomadura rupiterrae]MCP2342915.1 ferredoxin-NADP reductase [Actinomadura rupiterrae]